MKSKTRKRLPEPRPLYEPPRGDYTELLMRHVLRAATRCKSPTTANIAAEAGISEECCHQIMSMAQDFGFIEFVSGAGPIQPKTIPLRRFAERFGKRGTISE